jgi:hypothetical protein
LSRSSSIGIRRCSRPIAPFLPVGLGAPAPAAHSASRSTTWCDRCRDIALIGAALGLAWLSFRRQEL